MKIEVIANKLGLSLDQGVPTGIYFGYPYFVSNLQIDTFVKIPVMIFVFERRLTKEEMKEIQKTSGSAQVRFDSVILEDNAVFLMFRYGVKLNQKHQDYVEKVINKFSELGLNPIDHCPFCGNEDTDSTRIIKGAIVKVHDHCATEFYEKVQNHLASEEKSNKNLGKSLVFALFGAVAGVIPTVITITVFQYMFALLFALIPLASFYGYKYGGAPKKAWVPFIVSLFSLVIVFLMIVMLYIQIAESYSVTFEEAMTVTEFSASFFTDLGTSVLFLGVGVLVSWRQMYRQTTSGVKKSFEGLK